MGAREQPALLALEDKNKSQGFLVFPEKDPSLTVVLKTKKSKPPKVKSDSSDTDRMLHRDPRLRDKGARKSTRRCGECNACHKTEDCSRCDFCKDMKKFGGPNKIRQKCRLRQCLNFGLNASVTKLEAEAAFTSMNDSERNEGLMDDDDYDYMSENVVQPKARKRRSSSSDASSPRKKNKKDKKQHKDKHKRDKARHRRSPSKKEKLREKLSVTSKKRYADVEDFGDADDETPRHCCGPACVEAARTGSKYCSDECGMKLAKSRIYEILPSRIQQWQSSPCVAEEGNKKVLEKIRRQQMDARIQLGELDKRHQALDALIERAKHATVDPEQLGADTDDDTEFTIYCVTCGGEINQRGALKHMEKCYAKFESQTSFGSIYKTHIEGTSMFCDFYNAQQKTYCKRLKVLCPEHTKEPKVNPDEVCGCPLVSHVFEETGEFCAAPKRKCSKHYVWEKLRRAEIDMERVRQWLRIDELFEQERNIRMSMSNRMGVLGLMLHQTMDHDPLTPMIPPQQSS
ncbi:CXXC-type zinc finger protein 1-like [Gigantopelta aegis]|uniref:CXXC-type zinc finger protein 1-like n=1 Tax=Gigantopelta aegis TaxID=1735272 RepID=UPI001B88D708|nr:CXXC-type zinc finger protein 1-like [Gigantopelta aegis]